MTTAAPAFDEQATRVDHRTTVVQTPLERHLASPASDILSAEEEARLLKLSHAGDLVARNELIERNVRLMVKLAKRYGNAVDVDDMVGEATIAIIRAIEKFDASKAGKLSTYATWWIRQRYGRMMNQSSIVHVPVDISQAVRSTVRNFERTHGTSPTDAEVHAEIGPENHRYTLERVQLARRAFATLSLDRTLTLDSDTTAHEVVGDDRNLRLQDDFVALTSDRETLRVLLTDLSYDDCDLIARRFGLADYAPHTLDEVAALTGETKIQVRRREHRILKALREVAC